MKKIISLGIVCLFLGVIAISQIQCTSTNENKEMTKEEMVARGKYLVNLGGCNDCHSPKIMTAMGPIPDTTRLLSGHPANEMLAPIDPSMIAPGKWVLTSGTDFTAWVGPWGISYAANLSPDRETGTGAWTPEVFIKALRTGKMMGAGRPILPPMPWQAIGQLPDKDLKAIFAYLQSIPAVKNQVPNAVPPNMIEAMNKKDMKNMGKKKEVKEMKKMKTPSKKM